jgi:phenylacetate-CoA ligase
MTSHLKEKIYLASPVLLQNIIVSIYGLIEHQRRYQGSFKQLSHELTENTFKSKNELDLIQSELLNNTLTNALTNVPFYQHKKIQTANINAFPIVSRDEVFDDPKSFISNKYNCNTLLKLYTGGSSGSPLTIYLNKSIRQKSYAFWNVFYQCMGFNIGEKKASLVGRKLQEPNNDKPPFWRYNLYDRQLLLSSYHLNTRNIPLYINKLNSFKPIIIEGYPLSILRIAEYIIEHNVTLTFTPNAISTSSENFTQQQRNTMEKAFNCQVYDQYGSAESAVFASDCEHKNKHISIEYGLIEVLTKDGAIVREGEGELIVTSLLNDVMPLIRYRIGDLGKVSLKKCPCGRNSPILEELYGKTGAVIVSGDKTIPTAAIAIAFEYLKNVKKSQLIQNEPNRVIARLITQPGFDKAEEDFMRWELQKMLGDTMQIEVELVDHIPAGHNGKYQMVVQNYYKGKSSLTAIE